MSRGSVVNILRLRERLTAGTMTRFNVALLSLLAGVGVLCSSSRAASTTASVTVLAVSPFGEILRPVKVKRFQGEEGRGRDYASHFSDNKADGIPYGKYFAQVAAGDRGIGAWVYVDRADTLLVLSGPKWFIERGPGSPGVVGRVTGASGVTPIWVRLVKVFSEDVCCTIAPLSKDGTFSYAGLEEAEYVLLVLSDRRVLFEGRARIGSDSLIDIDLVKAEVTVRPQ
jgi:hypothetical protein